MSDLFVPENTRKNNSWAYGNFQAWRDQRNLSLPDDQCPMDLIDSPPWDAETMTHWLSRYACETRSVTGEQYPATTVYALLSGLWRHIQAIDAECPNFLDSKDPRFRCMHSVINRYFRELREVGVGAKVKRAEVIRKDEELALWEKEDILNHITEGSCVWHPIFYTNTLHCPYTCNAT